MRMCPRCSKNLLLEDDVMNSHSHTHNGVIICNACGDDEALTLAGLGDTDAEARQIKWENWKA